MSVTGDEVAKRGDIVRCKEAPDYLDRHITVGAEYVINKIERQHGTTYYRILADDNRGVSLRYTLFTVKKPREVKS